MLLKSRRLRQIAKFVRQAAPMADIGTDHALLPCFLVRHNVVPNAVAVEVNRGPYEAAKRFVENSGLADRIDVRLHNGLNGLRPGEVDTIVIAGMGGKLIRHILTERQDIVATTKRLVLQPNVAADKLRRWMLDNRWQLIDEQIVYEQHHLYDILVAEQGLPEEPYKKTDGKFTRERMIEVGPILWQKQHPLLQAKLESHVSKWEQILQQLTTSKSEQSEEKRSQIEKQLYEWKEMIACLPKENTSSAFSKDGSPRT